MAEEITPEEKARVTQKWVRIGATVGCLIFVLLKYGPTTQSKNEVLTSNRDLTNLAKNRERVRQKYAQFNALPIFNDGRRKPNEFQEGQEYAYHSEYDPLEIIRMQSGGLFSLEGVHVAYKERSNINRTSIPLDTYFIKMPLGGSKLVNGDTLPSMVIKCEGRYSNGDRGFKFVRWK